MGERRGEVLVIGGGTMGQGIALACALAGYATTISELASAIPRVRAGLDRFVDERLAKGKLSEADAARVRAIRVEEGLAAAASADWCIEAVVEILEEKRKLLAALAARTKPGALLCTNTSSLSVTAMAAGLAVPGAVLGLHFFNPATVMPLVEVVRTCWSEPATLERAVAFVKSLRKVPVLVKDTPGFVVNRVARPFPLESLRIVSEGLATPAQVDRILRQGGGFKMGPFELMDLVGIDINFAVTQTVFRAYFEEPRFRPSILQQELVNAGRLGRKTGQGVYSYGKEAPKEQAAAAYGSPLPLEGGGLGRGSANLEAVVVPGPHAPSDAGALVSRGAAKAWDAARVEREGSLERGARLVLLFADAPPAEQRRWLAALGQGADPATVVALHAPRLSVSELAAAYPHPSRVVGFGFLEGRLAAGNLVEVAPGLRSDPAATDEVEAFFRGQGLETERVGDQGSLVLRRVLFMIMNEATWALQEGVASREDIDLGMKLGTGYPSGPLEWADAIGLDRVYGGLAALQEEYGDDRFRPCPLLRKMVAAGLTGRRAGAGFYTYPAEERSGL
jgi:3-hydroxybutyryl-CoA dehydrogenase